MRRRVTAFYDWLERIRGAVSASLAAEREQRGHSNASVTDFLPAALEVLETPPSPAGRALAWLIMAFVVLALFWSIVGHVDMVAVAQGKVVPVGHSKIVQPSDAGVVKAIYVENGQHVRAGDILLELDAVEPSSDLLGTQAALTSARLDVAQHEAMALMIRRASLSVDGAFQPPNNVSDDKISARKHLLAAEIQSFRSRVAAQDAEINGLRAERDGAVTVVSKLDQTVPMLRQRVQVKEELLAAGYQSQTAQMELRQKLVELEHELLMQQDRLASAAAKLAQSEKQRQRVVEETLREKLTAREESSKRMLELSQSVRKYSYQQDQKTLTAPVDGVVQQLAVHTIGGVVTKAQSLLIIAPESGEAVLEVEADVLNRDIGFVRSGQVAEIKLEAFPFTRYGTVSGTVMSVSRDAAKDEKLGAIYPVRIQLTGTGLSADGVNYPLELGMAALVEIKTGDRRIIEYLLSPIKAYRHDAFRER